MEFKKLPKRYSDKNISKIYFSQQKWNYPEQTFKRFHLFVTFICIVFGIIWLYNVNDSIAIIAGSFYTFMFCKHFIEILNVRKNR